MTATDHARRLPMVVHITLSYSPKSQECLPHDSTDNTVYTHHTLCTHKQWPQFIPGLLTCVDLLDLRAWIRVCGGCPVNCHTGSNWLQYRPLQSRASAATGSCCGTQSLTGSKRQQTTSISSPQTACTSGTVDQHRTAHLVRGG